MEISDRAAATLGTQATAVSEALVVEILVVAEQAEAGKLRFEDCRNSRF